MKPRSTKNSRSQVWYRTLRRYRKLHRQLHDSPGLGITQKLYRKLDLLSRRIHRLNRSWKLGIASTVLATWLAQAPVQAQKLPSPFNLSSLASGDGSRGTVFNGVSAEDKSGFSISSAGDFNGDGLDDLLISTYNADPDDRIDAGQTYLVFGKPGGLKEASFELSSLLSGDRADGFPINGLTSNALSGYSVASAGDINGDGFDDLIIGAKNATPPGSSFRSKAGEVYVVFGRPFLANTFDLQWIRQGDGTQGFSIEGIDARDYAGSGVASVGDINHDGFDDIIIGAYKASGSKRGEAYVVFGRASFDSSFDLSILESGDGSQGFVFKGNESFTYTANTLSSAGDFNADGYDDILIGIPEGNNSVGVSVLIFGRSSFDPVLTRSTFSNGDGSQGFVINGIDNLDHAGSSVSTAGDVNGDGFDDILIGASGADPNGNMEAGEAYLIFGNDSTRSSLFLSGLVTFSDTLGLTISGIDADDQVGFSMSPAGDVNGDGFYDFLIGAPGADPGGNSEAGETYLIFGKDSLGVGINLSDLSPGNDSLGIVIEGIDALDKSSQPAPLGDFNGDGIDDFLISASQASPGGRSQAGETYLIFGFREDSLLSNQVPLVANPILDQNLDEGFSRTTINLGTTFFDPEGDNLNLRVISSDTSIVQAAISGNTLTLNEGTSGTSRITLSAQDSQGAEASQTFTVHIPFNSFPVEYDPSNLYFGNGKEGIILDADNLFRGRLSSAGDLNQDGLEDIIIGAYDSDPFNDVNRRGQGEIFVVFGRTENLGVNYMLSTLSSGDASEGFVINGFNRQNRAGAAVSSNGDVNGDGVNDIVIGGYHATVDGNKFAGEVFVVFGKDNYQPTFELSSLINGDGSEGFIIQGSNPYDYAGRFVHIVGDVNGDGFDDIYIEVPGADNVGSEIENFDGAGYLIFGQPNFAPNLALASIDAGDGSQGVKLFTLDAKSIAISKAGDFNGDGYDDLLYGSSNANPNDSIRAGRSYVIFGKPSFGASLELSSLTTGDGSQGFVLNGINSSDASGSRVAPGGDLNKDGLDDIIIQATYADPNGINSAGEVYVVFGQTNVQPIFELKDLPLGDGSQGFVLSGSNILDRLGNPSITPGDINGDGFDDLMISSSAGSGGETYLIYGKDNFDPIMEVSDLASGNGESGIIFNEAGGAIAGDFNGDGFDDIFDVARFGQYDVSLIFGRGIREPNQLPVLDNPLADQIQDEGFVSDTLSLSNIFSDPDNDSLSLSASTSDPNILKVRISGDSLILNEVAPGVANVSVFAIDNRGGQVSETFSFTIRAAQPPILLNPIPDQELNVGFGMATILLDSTFTDPAQDTLSLSVVSSAPDVVAASINGTNLILNEVGQGNSTLTLTATNKSGKQVSDSFTVTVSDNLFPMVINPVPDQTFNPGSNTNLINLDNVFSDPDSQSLTFSVTSSDPTVVSPSISNNILSLQVLGSGTATITITAIDDLGAQASTSFTVRISSNQAPVVANAIADQNFTAGFVSSNISLAQVFSDPDKDSLSFRATSSDLNVISLSISGSTLTLSEVASGTAVITVTADDNQGGQVSDNFTVRVRSNQAPVIGNAIADQNFTAGFVSSNISLAQVFSDPDKDSLSLSATSSDLNVITPSINGSTLTLSEVASGTANITVTADDNQGGLVSDIFTVTVSDSVTTSVEDPIRASIQLRPMPIRDRVRIEGFQGSYEYILTDAQGHILHKGEGKEDFILDMKTYPAGKYFINFIYRGVNFSKKLVKL